MTLLALRVLLGGWFKSAWAFICRYPLQAALIASLACNVWLWQSRAACLAVKQETKAAQKQATVDQVKTNQRPAIVTGAIAGESNAQGPAYQRSLRDAADRHAIKLRAPAGPASNVDLRGPDPAGPSVHGSDQQPGEPGAELVCRTAAEDRWIIDKVGRFAQMHADAAAMIAAGVAVAEPDLPTEGR